MPRREHPEKSSLLALLRGQQLEDQQGIRLHLTRCSQCQQIYADLSLESRPLDVLDQMARYQRYPELSPVVILRQAQRNAQKQNIWSQLAFLTLNRPRPKKTAVRLVSLPVAFGIGLLCMTVIIVLAYTFTHFATVYLPGISPGGIINNNQPNSGVFIKGQISPTPNPTRIATVTTTSTGTPGKSHHKPSIADCSAKTDIANFSLKICGSNFKPGDTVVVTVKESGNQTYTITTSVSVDRKGKFKASLEINSCLYGLLEISAEDILTNPVTSSNTLWETTPWWSCRGPNTYQG